MGILTVSGLYGSGGSEVAALVAKALDWPLLDNAVVDAVASRMGLTVAEVRDREERGPSLVERLTSAMAKGSQGWLSRIAAPARPPGEPPRERTGRIAHDASARGARVAVESRGADMPLRSGDELGVPERSWISRNAGIVAAGITSAALVFAAIIRP